MFAMLGTRQRAKGTRPGQPARADEETHATVYTHIHTQRETVNKRGHTHTHAHTNTNTQCIHTMYTSRVGGSPAPSLLPP